MGRLTGRSIIVTGAAQGIGAVYARALAAEGARLSLCDLTEPRSVADEIRAAGGEALSFVTDVTSAAAIAAQVKATVAAYGTVHGLVNNAAMFGSLALKPFMEIESAEWDQVMAVNTRGPFECVKAVVPVMRAQKYGKIINIASGTVFKGTTHLMHYVASKGAVVAMTRVMARELGPDNILVNCIAPGLTLSAAVQATYTRAGIDQTTASRALKRDEEPEDIIGAVIFFAFGRKRFHHRSNAAGRRRLSDALGGRHHAQRRCFADEDAFADGDQRGAIFERSARDDRARAGGGAFVFAHGRADVVAGELAEVTARAVPAHAFDRRFEPHRREVAQFARGFHAERDEQGVGAMGEARQPRPRCRARSAAARQRGDDDDAEGARAQHDVGGARRPDRIADRDAHQPFEPHAGRGQRRREEVGADQRAEAAAGRHRQEPRGQRTAAGAGRALERGDRSARETAAQNAVESGQPGAQHRVFAEGERGRRGVAMALIESFPEGGEGRIHWHGSPIVSNICSIVKAPRRG